MASRLLLALLVSSAAACGAAELGTLFHTPQEREQLDRLRRGEPVEAAASPDAPARPPRDPVMTGFVRRSDGRNTVWIDGRPLATRDDPRAVDPKSVRRVQPPLPPVPEDKDNAGAKGAAEQKPAPAASTSPNPPRS